MSPSSKATEAAPLSAENHISTAAVNLGTVSAHGAPPVPVAVVVEDSLAATLQARLTNEMLDLAAGLIKFARGAQTIGEELPAGAKFGKHVTLVLSCLALQFAQACLKDSNRALLLDDGALHLHELGLSVHDFLRQVDLDGRSFLAVALIDQQASQLEGRLKNGQAG